MNILLDTHALLWWLTADSKLTSKAKTAIEDLTATRYISAATAYEITNKIRLGKLDFGRPIADDFDSIFAE